MNEYEENQVYMDEIIIININVNVTMGNLYK